MVVVYFQDEKNISSELVATFQDEELYMACLPILEVLAKKQRCIVTESVKLDEIEHAKETLNKEGYYLDNLEHKSNIMARYNCTLEEAGQILHLTYSSEYISSEINIAIDETAEALGFKIE